MSEASITVNARYENDRGEENIFGDRWLLGFYNRAWDKGRVTRETINELWKHAHWLSDVKVKFELPPPHARAIVRDVWFTSGGNYGYVHANIILPNESERYHIIENCHNVRNFDKRVGELLWEWNGSSNVHSNYPLALEGKSTGKRYVLTYKENATFSNNNLIRCMIYRIKRHNNNRTLEIWTLLFNLQCVVTFNTGKRVIVQASNDGVIWIDNYSDPNDGNSWLYISTVHYEVYEGPKYLIHDNDNNINLFQHYYQKDVLTIMGFHWVDSEGACKVILNNSFGNIKVHDLISNRTATLPGSHKGFHRTWHPLGFGATNGRLKLNIEGTPITHSILH